jgi:hypothetical protein
MNADLDIDYRCTFNLGIASVFRDEALYLKEWIEFHLMLGVQRIVLVNDRSSDDFLAVLQPYIDAGIVKLFDWPCPSRLQGRGWIQYQLAVVRALVSLVRGVCRWLALIDIDEFIVPAQASNLVEYLSDYEAYGGIYIRWEPFGTSYIKKLPEGALIIEALKLKWRFVAGHDMLGKSIVKPHRVLHPNIHRCELLPQFTYFDTNPGMQNEFSLIRINHYWARDEDFLFGVKLNRTAQIKGWVLDDDKLEYFKHLFNDCLDRSMERFTRQLKTRML